MATTRTKSESMKNKSNMWGGATPKSQGDSKAKSTKSTKSKSSASQSLTKDSSKSKTSSTGSRSLKTGATAKGGKTMNHKTEFAQDMTKLNDVEIISDVLNTHKGLIKLYGTALCESSCENLRDLVGRHLTEAGEDQFDVFLYMSERNLYPTEDAEAQKLKTAKDKFNQYEKQMKI